VAPIVCSPAFTWPCDWALATVFCESSYNPNAVGTEVVNGIRYDFNGLFQVVGGSFEPWENAMQAHKQYLEWQQGLRPRPWPNCP